MYRYFDKSPRYKIIKQDEIEYIIDFEQKTSSVSQCYSMNTNVLIPKSISYESADYDVISILEQAFYSSHIQSIQFPSNSKLQIIKKKAFEKASINSITIPASVVEIEEGWCEDVYKLNTIFVSQNSKLHQTYFIICIRYM